MGWLPDPLAWAPWEAIGDGRFDDPQRRFRVLDAAAQRRGVFVESLARFRPALEFLGRMRAVAGTEEPLLAPGIPTDWYRKRGVARFRLRAGQRRLDLRAGETREALRVEMSHALLELGLADLDWRA